MALTTAQCKAFNSFLGSRPFNWDKVIATDRKPHEYVYLTMYKTQKWASFTGTNHLHEKVYVARVNDPGLWPQFFADPCLGTPCDKDAIYVGHGVDQLSYGRFRREIRSAVFCLDQLNTIEEAPAKMGAIIQGYGKLPEDMEGNFIRQLAFRQAGTAADGAGLWLVGVQDASGNPVNIDVSDNMFAISSGGKAGTKNELFINLNANGALTTLANAGKLPSATTAGLVTNLSQITMEYLGNHQEDLAMQGYHDGDADLAGKFTITMDETTSRRLLVANPELRGLYSASDFVKNGAYYSYGMNAGCGDWLFKRDPQQWRFNFRSDLDGFNLDGSALTGAVWIEQIQPYENVAATFGIKPQYSAKWKAAPIRIYHAYNREARTVEVADISSINDEMKFGMARSFTGNMRWMHPSFFRAYDPATGSVCDIENVLDNKGFFLGEYDMGIKTVYPEIERWFLALGEATPYTRRPNTVTPVTAPASSTDYQNVVGYNGHCGDGVSAPLWGQTPFGAAVANDGDPILGPTSAMQGGASFEGYTTGIRPV